jgi:hypothetical protein
MCELHGSRSEAFPNLPAIHSALHRYEVSIYSQGHNWVVLTVFLPSNVAPFTTRIAEEKAGDRWPTIRPCPSFRGPGRPLRQTKESASLLIFTSTWRRGQETPVEDLSILTLLLPRTCDTVLIGPALHCTSFTSLSTF